MAGKKANTRRGFGAIRKLPSGRFQAKYQRPDLKGEYVKAPSTFPDREGAEGWLAEQRRNIDLGVWISPEEQQRKAEADELTVEQFFEQWLPLDKRKKSTQQTYRSVYNNRVAAYLGHRCLVEVTATEIENWVERLKVDYPETESRNASAYTLVATLFKKAVKRKLVEVTPCSVERASRKPKPKPKQQLSDAEYRELVAALPERYRMAVVIAEHCHLRISEWTELRRKDLAVDGGRVKIHVQRRVAWIDGVADYDDTKSEAGDRWISVSAAVAPSLLAYMDKFSGPGAEGLLFLNSAGRQIRHTRFREMLASYSTALFGRRVGSHAFRHRGATEYARAGATLKDLMARLGHTTAEMALVYQHTSQERDQALTDKLPVAWLPETV